MIAAGVQIRVFGDPIPKGSLKCVGRGGSHRIVEDNPRTSTWRTAIATAAAAAPLGTFAEPHQAIGVEITSTLARPAHHRGARGLRANAPEFPTNTRTGDVDKLARLVLDALVDARILVDDAQVVEVVSRKAFPEDPDRRPSGFPDVLDDPGILIRVYPFRE